MPHVKIDDVNKVKELRDNAIKYAKSFGQIDTSNPYYIQAVAYNIALIRLELDSSLTLDKIKELAGIL